MVQGVVFPLVPCCDSRRGRGRVHTDAWSVCGARAHAYVHAHEGEKPRATPRIMRGAAHVHNMRETLVFVIQIPWTVVFCTWTVISHPWTVPWTVVFSRVDRGGP